MKTKIKVLVTVSAILGTVFINESGATMQEKITRHFSQIQQNRPDLEERIKDAVNNNNQRYQNDPAKQLTLPASEPQIKLIEAPEGIEEIVDNDNLNELHRLKMQKGEEYLKELLIGMTFKGEESMKVPLIQYCVMRGAMLCFKYLLINGLGNPTKTMEKIVPGYYTPTKLSSIYGWDCLATAIYFGQIEMAKILEEKGIEPGSNPGHLEAAILSHRNGIAEWIINELQGKDAPNKQVILDAGLRAAAQSNNIKGLEILISKGADIKAKNAYGNTPLHMAAKYNTKDIGELLISKGANINAKDWWNRTPLHYAAMNDSKEMGKSLISKGADINAKSDYGDIPLHYAADYSSKEIGELLVSKGADINAKNKRGQTPLHYAAWANSKEIGEILVSKGADINAKDYRGWTPLHYAAWANSKDIGKILVSKGADINAKDYRGWTPLHCAAECNKKDIAELLISKGAYVNARAIGSYGRWTPLKVALNANKQYMVELLRRYGATE